MSRKGDTFLAFLLGVVAGGAVALLVAPEKGEVTRRKIRSGVTGIYGKGKDLVDDTADTIRSKAEEAAAATRSRVDALKGAVTEGREAYRREMSKDS